MRRTGEVGSTRTARENHSASTLCNSASRAASLAIVEKHNSAVPLNRFHRSADLAQGIALGVETGLRYTSRLRGDDTDLTGSFADVNDRAGRRLAVPVRLGGTITF